MKLTFLGTGTSQGVPVIACTCQTCLSDKPKDKRLRTSALIELKGLNYVIDTGPDFRQQMLRERVKDIRAILFTHEHKDHIAGLDDIRAFNYIHKRPMEVYADERVQKALRREYAYVFAEDKYPGIPRMNTHTIDTSPFFIEDIRIIPIRLMHYKLPILGFRINDLTYITDTNYIEPEEKEKIKGTKVLVVNALRKEKHISHFSLAEALELIDEIKPERAYLTHISHLMGRHADIEKELPKNVYPAYDGLSIEINSSKVP